MGEQDSAAAGASPAGQGGGSPQPDAEKDKGTGAKPAGESSAEVSKLEEARREASEERRKRQEVEAKLKEHEDAKLSESERLTNLAATNERNRLLAEQELHAERLARAIEREAGKFGFIDPEDAVMVIDRAAIKVDDSGKPDADSLDKALKALAAAKPHLVGARSTGSGDGGARRTSPAGSDMNSLIRQAAGRPA
jgi:hypothetical protein